MTKLYNTRREAERERKIGQMVYYDGLIKKYYLIDFGFKTTNRFLQKIKDLWNKFKQTIFFKELIEVLKIAIFTLTIYMSFIIVAIFIEIMLGT